MPSPRLRACTSASDVVEETPLDLRILDIGLELTQVKRNCHPQVSFPSPHIGELTVYSDDAWIREPVLVRIVDPVVVLASTRTTILVTIPSGFVADLPRQGQHDHRIHRVPLKAQDATYPRPRRSPNTHSSRQTMKPFGNPPLPIHQTTSLDWVTISTSLASSGLTLMGSLDVLLSSWF